MRISDWSSDVCSSDLALPVLRKGFIIDPYQLYEARSWGADCVLLIVAALDHGLMAELEACAHELGMSVLVEVHNADELSAALKVKTALHGVNNRKLRNIELSLQNTLALLTLIAADSCAIHEVGHLVIGRACVRERV